MKKSFAQGQSKKNHVKYYCSKLNSKSEQKEGEMNANISDNEKEN